MPNYTLLWQKIITARCMTAVFQKVIIGPFPPKGILNVLCN